MTNPKFKIGQVVYGRSLWFAGAFIPDIYTIRKSEFTGEGKVLYYVKGKRCAFEEEMFFATEEEAQLQEVKRFKIKKKMELDALKKLVEEVGMTNDEVLAIEAGVRTRRKHKYAVGQTVYGHMDGGVYDYKPEKFLITDVCEETVDDEKILTYKVKGHGMCTVLEEFLYPTFKDALIADIARFKRTTKVEVRSIGQRAITLGIESKVAELLPVNEYQKLIGYDK